jgi:outer membrane lipoprotein LolB
VTIRGLPAVILLTLVTQGCTHLKHSEKTEMAWEARRAQLAQVDRFTLQARVSSGGLFGVKGNLHWRQTPTGFDMRVAGPFGIGAATISGRGREVEIRTSKRSFVTQDPEGDLQARLGWTFPVSHLRYWVLGQPAPGTPADFEIDANGRIVTIEQDGWTLAFSEYQGAGSLELPRKFEVAGAELKLKVIVDTWSDLPALK